MTATYLPRAATAALVLCFAISTAASQSLLRQYGEVVWACGQPLPTSGGLATDFPAGAAAQLTSTGFTSPTIDLDGNMVFRIRAADSTALGITGQNAFGWVVGRSNGDLRLFLRGGDQAPGLPAGTFLRTSSATGNGLSALRTSPRSGFVIAGCGVYDPVTIPPASAQSAYFWGQPGALVPLARGGDLVPSLTNGEVFGAMDLGGSQSFTINDSGTVIIRNTMTSGVGGVTTANDGIFLIGQPGSLTKFLREGDVWTGVGMSGGETLIPYNTNTTYPTTAFILNANGSVLHDLHFALGSGTVPITGNDDRALAIHQGGTSYVIAREGQQAPGMPAGMLFADLAGQFAGFGSLVGNGFNKSNVAFFSANVSATPHTTGTQVLYLASVAGGLTYVAKAGDAAPASLGAGVTYVSFNSASMFLTDDGRIAMFATITGPGVSTTNDKVMLFGPPSNLQVIAREGDTYQPLGAPWTINDITGNPHVTERGQIVWNQSVSDGVTLNRQLWLSWTADLGLRTFYDQTETWTFPLGTGTPTNLSSAGTIYSGDTSTMTVNANGDFGGATLMASTIGWAIVRGRIGNLQASPAAIPTLAGGTQTLTIDCGPARAFNIYAVIASASGTRPGTPSPLGPQQIPLNFDAWTSLSLDLANSVIWTNSLWFLDANGKGTATFNVPPALVGWPTQLHHAVVTLDASLATTHATEPAAVKLY